MSDCRYATAEAHLAAADPVLARLISVWGACPLAPDPRYFYRLARAIVGQQLSVKAAASIWRRLEALLPGGEVTPQALLPLGEEALRAAGLSRPKIGYLRDLAVRVASGALDLEALSALPDEAVIQALQQVKGIGRWTAEMFLIFSLGRADVLPVDDQGFRAAVKRAYGLAALPTRAELEAIAAPWHPYASIGTWYLWRSLENAPDTPRQATDLPAPLPGAMNGW